ncbi:sensor histidine kinase [Aggregatilinea lenta]|uniref:sensor histidine kinase n=1 Tax=Aggregatilinea lenta TaxID=913108 RepID=UPI000E5A9D4F|nr:ATP-binding protein [Aggregatilinea lenta]
MNENSTYIQREELDEIGFSVNARVAMQLGRESISNSIVAILELVKNAYDADADYVNIVFSKTGSPDALLIIDDNGHGMTQQQLINNWMVIGTDNKAASKVSRNKNRNLVGEKGLGRLGLDRLGRIARVQTWSEDVDFGTELVIDWDKYEEQSRNRLEEIKHKLFRIAKTVSDPITSELEFRVKGTRIIVEGLKEDWTATVLHDLYRDLSLLVSPFSGEDDFSIWFETGQNSEFDGRIGSREILEAAEWKLVSSLHRKEEKWEISYEIVSPDVTSTFVEDWPLSSSPRCGSARFELYFFSRGDIPGTDDNVTFTKAQVNEFLDHNQGIRIYRDSFRVKPYGEPSGAGDWLQLALRRVRHPGGVRQPGQWKVGYNQIVGAVFISRADNPALSDQTNREGIVDGPAYWDLKAFTLRGVEFFERRRQIYERSQERPDEFDDVRKDALESSRGASNAIKGLRDSVEQLSLLMIQEDPSDSSELTSTLNQIVATAKQTESAVVSSRKAQNRMTRAYRQVQRDFEERKNTLGNLASLGILAAAFGHETLAHSNQVATNSALLMEQIDSIFPELEEVAASNVNIMLDNINFGASRINMFAEFMLANVQRDKRRRTAVYLDQVIESIFRTFDLPQTRQINVDLDFPSGRVPPILAFRIDWESILVNLLTNAVWALTATPAEHRNIRVRIRIRNKHLILSFADGGRGIEPGTIDRIFEPTFSTRRNDQGTVIGTGMGLAIVENLLQSYTGTIQVESPSELGGAEFHISVPIPALDKRGKRS